MGWTAAAVGVAGLLYGYHQSQNTGINTGAQNAYAEADRAAQQAAFEGGGEEGLEAAAMMAEAQIEAARLGKEAVLENTALGQKFLKEGADYAYGAMSPYAWSGWRSLPALEEMSKQGYLPEFQWDKKFDYEPFQWDREWNPQSWDREWTPTSWDRELKYQPWEEFAKTRLGKENIKNSPFYSLYEWQNEQQQEAIDKAQRARGGFKSGAAMKEALKAETGLEQQFTADEYNRALGEYATKSGQTGDEYAKAFQTWAANTDLSGREYNEAMKAWAANTDLSGQVYSQALQDYITNHSTGYNEAKDKYNMDWDQELKKYALDYGLKTDELNNVRNMVNMGFTADQAIANAKMGSATTSAQMSGQAGTAIGSIYSNMGQGLGQGYIAQMNNAARAAEGAANRGLTASLAGQDQSNWQWANQQNQALGLGQLGTGLARTGLNAYNMWNNSNSIPAGTGSLGSSYYGNQGAQWGYSPTLNQPYSYMPGYESTAGIGYW